MTRRYLPTKPSAICPGCGRRYTLIRDGLLRAHNSFLFSTKACRARVPIKGTEMTGVPTGAVR